MRLWPCEQGSQRWLELRMGRPTASAMDRIITPGGAPSKSANGYCNELIAEVLLGRPLLGEITGPMQRGKEMESEAVKYYELIKDVETVPVGFMTTDDGRVGGSPDRLVGDVGLLEVKAPSETTASKYLAAHIDSLLGVNGGGSVYDAYRVQVQTQLYVCERDWCDIISYFPGLPEALTRVPRDEKFIAALKVELAKFLEMLDTRLEKLRQLGYLDEMAARKAKGKQAKQEPEIGAFGLSEDDINSYVASLKNSGVFA